MKVKLTKIMPLPTGNQVTSTTGPGITEPELDDGTSQAVPVTSLRQHYTKANLPFPPGGNHRHVWAKCYRPALLSWAGSQDDPFGTNGMMHDEMSCIWHRLYPDIPLNNENMTILVDVVRHTSLPIPTKNDY
jgi:hypothetical protein